MNLLQLFWECVLHSKCETLKKQDILQDYRMESTEEGVIDLYVIPKKIIQHINIDIIVSPSGATFS